MQRRARDADERRDVTRPVQQTEQGAAPGVSVIETAQLGKWAASWHRLVTTASVPSPFMHSWWLEAVASKPVTYLLVVDQGELLGGFALQRHGALGLTAFRTPGPTSLCPDHLDLLVAAGHEQVVRAAIATWFAGHRSVIVDIRGVVEKSHLELALPRARVKVLDVAPWACVPSGGSAYLAGLSSRLRRQVRRAERRMASHNLASHTICLDEFDSTLRDFERLQGARGDRRALLAEMPRLGPALRAGMAAGEVRIDVLQASGDTVAVSISFVIAGRLRLYQSARSFAPEFRDVGSMLLFYVIGQACDDGCREVDFLRGAEPYKLRFTDRERRVLHLRAAHGARANAILHVLVQLERARKAAGAARRWYRDQRGAGLVARKRPRSAE